jgi:hypothetical protein
MAHTTHAPRAFPATDTESGAARKVRYLENLRRELPLARQRRDEKRARYIATLRAHIGAGLPKDTFRTLHPSAHLDEPDTALLHCLFRKEDDLAAYAAEIGLPVSTLALYQHFFNRKRHDARLPAVAATLKEDETDEHFGFEWLDAITPDADLTLLPVHFVLTLLCDAEAGIFNLTSNPTLCAALDSIGALHARVIQGDTPGRQEWRTLQRGLLAYTDSARAEGVLSPLDDLLAQIAENAAIDCTESDVIGDEIVEFVVQALVLIQSPKEEYSPEETAMNARIDAPRRSEEEHAAFRVELALPHNAALLEKRDAYWNTKLVTRSRVEHTLACLLIHLTRMMPVDQAR